MKQNTIMVFIVLCIFLFAQSCGAPEVDVAATVQVVRTQDALVVEQTAVALTQTAMESEKIALAATQTAMAAVPIIEPAGAIPTEPPAQKSEDITCPFYVYQDWGVEANHFVPEGWMGDISDINLDENYKLDPERPNVMQITYKPSGSEQWVGVYWWAPGNDWGNQDSGFDISCATNLTFWARGEKGGEKAEFKVGGLAGVYSDSLQPALSSGPITLTNKWVQYTIALSGEDLSHIMGGFVWVTKKPANPNGAVIYIDDVRFE